MELIFSLFINIVLKGLIYAFVYLVFTPLLYITGFLYDIGLIWSLVFYGITEFFFQAHVVQDYRILITGLLLFPFFYKLFKGMRNIIGRIQTRKQMKELRRRQAEEQDNDYYE